MTDCVIELKYRRHPVRGTISAGVAWVVAEDVGNAIGLKAPKGPVTRLPEHEKALLQVGGAGPRLRMISVEGVQRLAGSVRAPGAMAFLDWFRTQAMPQIALALQYDAEPVDDPVESAPVAALPGAAAGAVVAADLTLDTGRSFLYGEMPVRMQVDQEGEILFNANDVCEALELTNPRKAVDDHVDPDDVTRSDTIDAKGRFQQSNYVNLSGLYALIFGSKKDAARKFKRWVTHDVLPAIQKTGSYSVHANPQRSEFVTARQTEAQRLARLANTAALSAALRDDTAAANAQMQARAALARLTQAERHLRDLRIEIQFRNGLEQPVANAAYPEPLLTREGRAATGKTLAGRIYLIEFEGNLDRPRVRPLLSGEHLVKATVDGVKFLANQGRLGLDEWLDLSDWADKKVRAERNRR